MGKEPKGIAARSDRLNDCEAHHVGISPQEDRGGATGTVGEGEGGEEGAAKVGRENEAAAPVARLSC